MELSDSSLFLKSLPACKTSTEVGDAYTCFIKSHGFLFAAAGESRETPDGRTWDFFFNTWPADWLREYHQNDYVRHDLVPAMARFYTEPFTWREALDRENITAKQLEHFNWAKSRGIADIFAVPIHYPAGDFGLCVTISGHKIDDAFERAPLQIASIFAHQRCRELGGLDGASSTSTPLTPREIECLRWVIKGKSDNDIGRILDISHTTVHFHIERVKKKLGVKTRIQAAAMVTTLGYL